VGNLRDDTGSARRASRARVDLDPEVSEAGAVVQARPPEEPRHGPGPSHDERALVSAAVVGDELDPDQRSFRPT
jgi:hypothetical protein